MSHINPFLSIYKNEIKDILDFKQNDLLNELLRNGCIASSFENIYNCKTEIVGDKILSLNTEDFLRVLSSVNHPLSTQLHYRIVTTFSNLINVVKQRIREKITSINILPFWSGKSVNIKFENIQVPLKVFASTNKHFEVGNILHEINMFTGLEKKDRLLIFGETGKGKTFQCLRILNHWSFSRICLDFLFLHLKVTDLLPTETIYDTLIKQNFPEDTLYFRNVLKYYLEDNTSGNIKIILLVEDLDELYKTSLNDSEIIQKLEMFPHILICWTRTHRIDRMIRNFNITLEILGFADDDIRAFFLKFFSEMDDNNRKETLYHYLKGEKPTFFQMCFNPFFATLFAAIWENLKIIPDNKYLAIEEATNILLKRCGLIPKTKDYCEIIKYIGKQCLEFILNNKPMTCNHIIESTNNLGGLVFLKTFNLKNQILCKEYEFLHFSFHEYFTAKYLIEFFKTTKEDGEKEDILESLSSIKNIIKLKNIFEFINVLDRQLYLLITQNKESFSFFQDDSHYHLVEKLRLNNSSMEVSHLENCKASNVLFKFILSKYSSKFTTLILRNVFFDDFFFIMAFTNELEKLKILFDTKFEKYISYMDIFVFLSRFNNFKKLTLKNVNLIFPKNFNPSSEMSVWKKLHLQKCKFYETGENYGYTEISSPFSPFQSGTIVDFQRRISKEKTIESLTLFNYSREVNNSLVSYKMSCQGLTEIVIYCDVAELKDFQLFISATADNLVHLKKLKIKNCYHSINGDAISLVLKRNEQLETLELLGIVITERNNYAFIRSLAELKCLKKLKLPKIEYQQTVSKYEKRIKISFTIKFSLTKFAAFDSLRVVSHGEFQRDFINQQICINQISNVKELYLNGCCLSSSFLDIFNCNLKKIPFLKVLDISKNDFTNDSSLKFFRNINLLEMNIEILLFYAQKNVTNEILLCLVQTLKENRKLKILNSSRNNFEKSFLFQDDFVNSKEFNLESSLRIYNHYKCLLLNGKCNIYSDKPETTLIFNSIGLKINELCLNNICIPVQFLKNILKDNHYIKELFINNCDISQESSEYLGRLIRYQNDLKFIAFIKVDLSASIGENLFYNYPSKCCNLITLRLDDCILSNDMSVYLGKFLEYQTDLNELCLTSASLLSDIGKNIFLRAECVGNFIGSSPNLKILDLSSVNMLDDIGKIIFKTFSQGCLFIAQQLRLKTLNLQSVNFREGIGRNLLGGVPLGLCGIEVINLKNSVICEETAYYLGLLLSHQTQLKSLNLEYNNLSGKIGMNVFLYEGQPKRDVNFEINLKQSIFSAESVHCLGKFIGLYSHISSLNLSLLDLSCGIGNHLFKNMNFEQSIMDNLDLSYCKLSFDFVESFVTFFDSLSKINELDWSNVDLSDTTGVSLFSNLTSRSVRVVYMNCDNCVICSKMSKYFGAFIEQCNLSALSLRSVDLSGERGKTLFEGISSKCCNITDLFLSECKFSTDMSFFLGQFIGYQTKLRTLEMTGTDLSDDIGKNIFENISQRCFKIISLNISNCKFSSNMTDYLTKALDMNSELWVVNLSSTDLTFNGGKHVIEKLSSSFIKNVDLTNCTF
ncbi:DgyrCDS14859 [Dimorphilus gyrociliatus]|uniref:DgyrCDS14859 n=1 Tax=Dimorphilus gyrociliatus TaxID=2664684 RepID=A0A7I8WF45_9ANNE|nr:DgyrCDS14859 [Dimorphilus gyrociliatus]